MNRPLIDLPIAVDVNFDSLNFYCGFPEGLRDPTYFRIFDRFIAIANERGFKLSIFVIGRDLQNPEIAARIREWSIDGHEIGNHTWSHSLSFGAMPPLKIEEEIVRTHEIIYKTTGQQPVGFIAPGWSSSAQVYKVLIQHGYKYDTSHFPSLLFYAIFLKAMLNNRDDISTVKTIANRKDWLWPMTKPIDPFFINARGEVVAKDHESIMVLPVPTFNRFSLSFWHTLGFIIGWDRTHKFLKRLVDRKRAFYYLCHPLDLAEQEDLSGLQLSFFMERMTVELPEKLSAFNSSMGLLQASGRKIGTMSELADAILKSET